MKKIISLILAAALICSCFTACGKDETSVALETIENPTTYEEYLNNAKIISLTQTGNTYRLKQAIEKAESGEDCNIVYIGGSITEGDGLETCYAYRSFTYFQEKFGKGNGDNVHYYNSGISGTPSTLGALRFEDDVEAYSPDIVFIEFAVNDGSDSEYYDAFESLIRDCLQCESHPAVILLFARMEEGWTSQDWKKEIGKYYDLPMISYADGITYLFDNGALEWSEFSDDYTHPNADGNAVVAEFIAYFFDEVDRLDGSTSDITIPSAMYECTYENAHMLQHSTYEATDLGSWKEKSSGFHYSDGWTKTFDELNDPLVFTFTGTNAYVVYPTSSGADYGTLEAKVYFNGELVNSEIFNEYDESGWLCPSVGILYRAEESGEFRVEFTAYGDSVKCDLQVLAVAYTD
ncbi:MAG: SGNH/GDSL hydrolase family protein [Oscillospiraceae bacterium]|nr:SGNH/GDSL hydrolase family protein [Oscillospiraceae bacterium]